jgi:hypothetical protein
MCQAGGMPRPRARASLTTLTPPALSECERRVEFHISAHLPVDRHPGQQNGLETALEQMSHLAVAAVECLLNHTVEVAHHPRQVRAARVQHEVIVIAHQAIGEHLHVKALHTLLQHAEQRSTVAVDLEDRLAPVAARCEVVDRIRELDAQGAGHGGGIAGVGAKGKT